jgi:hypothetical protein
MSWRFRRSLSLGWLRFNLSRRGIGWSWGVPGLRYGRTSTGRPYVSVGFPGLGLYWMKYLGVERLRPAEPTDENPLSTQRWRQLR